jgi:hypothetical protein
MLVSLNKNQWLWAYIYEKVDSMDPEFRNYLVTNFSKTRPEEIKTQVLRKFETFGYKVKLTSSKDAIISMKEEEYMFLKLKYQ